MKIKVTRLNEPSLNEPSDKAINDVTTELKKIITKRGISVFDNSKLPAKIAR